MDEFVEKEKLDSDNENSNEIKETEKTAQPESADTLAEPVQTAYRPQNTYQPVYPQHSAQQYTPYGNQPQNAGPVCPQNNTNNTYYAYVPPKAPVELPKQHKSNKKGRKVFFIILAAVIALTAVAVPMSLAGRNSGNTNNNGSINGEVPTINEDAPSIDINETPASDQGSAGGILTPEQVYEKIADINVAIIVYKNNAVYTEGTGIIMKEDSAGKYTYILTCAHVISDSGTEVVVQFEDGERYDAQIVGYDARTDIGVLRINATGFKAAEFGNSDALKVGSTVYAIGNPGGSALFGTFTDGKVSAIGRNITSSIGYDMVCIQHNAAISPGNSGGALVNEYGQVIGINSSKIAATEYEGISFSIPITQAQDVINKVISYGYVPGRAKLGISYVANDSSAINSVYGMAVQMMDLPSGSLVIYSIDSNSALANTDAQPGDMITAVNGKDLDTADVLLETIEDSSVGDVIELTLFRIETVGGKYSTSEFKVKATLIEETNYSGAEETTTHGVYGNDEGFGYDFGF
ncbi:MAG: trypsin-like peptidase domain-containing protein [Clostridia bacterium]|nr:trypsin-like peptidase domain-containing protein [Clostridia bacterium]